MSIDGVAVRPLRRRSPMLPVTTRVAAPGARVWQSSPVRVPLFALIFCALALDVPKENSFGYWDSPLAPLGGLLTENLNKTLPLSWLKFPFSAVALFVMLLVSMPTLVAAWQGRRAGSRVAAPLLSAVALSLTTVAILVGLGALTGGDLQMAKNQTQSFVLLLVAAAVSAATFRGPKDYRTLGRLIIVAAAVKALMALWMVTMVLPAAVKAQESYFATAHGDSLTFGCAIIILVANWIETPRLSKHLTSLLFALIIVAGMIANNRRLVWLEIGAAMALLPVIGPAWVKQTLRRWAVIAAVPILFYVAAGWNSDAGVFAPVRMLRSVQDSQVDASTLFRDIENYNLMQTLRRHPILGKGFGQPFDQVAANFDMSFFKEYYFLPHNSILGLWSFGGLVGFSGLSLVVAIGAFLAARSYGLSRPGDQRAAAFTALGMLAMYQLHCWGDIGFAEKRTAFLVGPALGLAGHLAMMTGAWRVDRSSRGRRMRGAR